MARRKSKLISKIRPGKSVIYPWGGSNYLGKVISLSKGIVRISHGHRVDVEVPAYRLIV